MDNPCQIDPERSLEYIWRHSKAFAKAKAERIYLEEYRKSLKAILMKKALEAGYEAANAQEREAYADPEYKTLLEGLRTAVEAEEAIRWGLVAAEAAIEIWRSKEASARQEIKAAL
jgi:hypothetical protein